MLCTRETHPVLFDSLRLAGYLQSAVGVTVHSKTVVLDERAGPERNFLWNTVSNMRVPVYNNRDDYVVEIFSPFAWITTEHAGIKARWSIVIHPKDAERLGVSNAHETNGI